jgi:hypothetical protein
MDNTIRNNAQLFDDLLRVLDKHHKEPGVVEAIDGLKAAKSNYVHRSIDHMMNCLVIAIHGLAFHGVKNELWSELGSVIEQYYRAIMQVGPRLSELAHRYEAGGGRLLNQDEILQEVDDRRGTSR